MEITAAEIPNRQYSFDEESFGAMFREHYAALHAYARVMLQDEELAEDVVQTMFLKLWEKRDALVIQTSLKAFLYRCVHNDSLNCLKHLKVRTGYTDHTAYLMKEENSKPVPGFELRELERRLHETLSELPEQCLTVFQMSRFEDLKYREIAERLGVSVKAVEKQMGNALKHLRLRLGDYLPLILLLITMGKIK
ncbi:MAG TPA: RNA polymerase sigma-70 factor [Sphingobacteriaceae bacterium]